MVSVWSGLATAQGLEGQPNPHSQANGVLMRITPLGIFGARHALATVGEWARQYAALTHPHPVCQQANALFAMAISWAIKTDPSPEGLYEQLVAWAVEEGVGVDCPGECPLAIAPCPQLLNWGHGYGDAGRGRTITKIRELSNSEKIGSGIYL